MTKYTTYVARVLIAVPDVVRKDQSYSDYSGKDRASIFLHDLLFEDNDCRLTHMYENGADFEMEVASIRKSWLVSLPVPDDDWLEEFEEEAE